jgi:polysaccharide pyruvyl transferase WcaK-like protein
MRVLTLLDTAVASTNLGDQIIMDAVRRQVADMLPDAFAYSVASHDYMGAKSRGLLRRSDIVLAGGTNLLSSRMWFRPLWKLTPLDAWRHLDVTLMGVGWYQFQSKPDSYTRFLLNGVLDPKALHSVRDGYSKTMLERAGVGNVVNTGCPTLWELTPDRTSAIPAHKAHQVVTTLNTYIKNPELDKRLLTTLHTHYEKVYFWVQTQTDYDYARQLDADLVYLQPSLRALDELFASSESLDYVGNRLHAGIRALQKGRRSIIVEIDNRAREMGGDFALPTVARDDFAKLERLIRDPFGVQLRLPLEAIARWKSQFHTAGT